METKYVHVIYMLFFLALLDKACGQEEEHPESDHDHGEEFGDTYNETLMYEKKCYILGHTFEQGPFIHPTLPCKACQCCKGGIITCTKKFCLKPKCGLGKQIPKEGDPCCKVCKPECEGVTCPSLGNCPKSRYAYTNESCCPECGCEYFGEGVPNGNFGHVCSACTCNASTNTAKCHRHCSANELTCVDPKFDIDCNLYCPVRTCRRGEEIIPVGKVKVLGRKLCVCSERWYPRAFCAFVMPPLLDRLRLPVYGKCVQYPRIPYQYLVV